MTSSRVALSLVLLAATPALADEFEGIGQSAILNGDVVRAREKALDAALQDAVKAAASFTQGPRLATAEGDLRLRTQVLPRARAYVSTYRVVEEGPQANLFHLKVAAQVDAAGLGRALAGGASSRPGAPSSTGKAKMVVCLVERGGAAAAWAGSAAESRLATAIGARGVDVVRAAGACAPAAGTDALDDARAATLVSARGATGAVVGTATVTADGLVRGTALQVARAQLDLAILDGTGHVLARQHADEAAYGPALADAGSAAIGQALDAALVELGPRLSSPASTNGGRPGVIVRAAGVGDWAQLVALEKALAAIPGVSAVAPHKFDASGVEIFVETAQHAPDLASALAAQPVGEVRFDASPSGDELRVTVEAAGPPSQPQPGAP